MSIISLTLCSNLLQWFWREFMQTIKITKERAEEISSQIFGLMKQEDCSVTELNRRLGLTSSRQNLHKKIKDGTLRYFEVLDIFQVLGYEVLLRKK